MNENPHDEPLLLRCKAGDRQAFRELASRYGKPVYGFLTAFAGADAKKKQALMSEAFTEGFRDYHAGESEATLLVLTLRSLLKLLAREKIPAKTGLEPLPDTTLHIQWALQALARHTMEQKSLILLRTQMDLLYAEMSFLLSIPEPALKSRLKQALQDYRKQIAEAMKEHYSELQQHPGKDPELP